MRYLGTKIKSCMGWKVSVVEKIENYACVCKSIGGH